jgi:hypothetical protein
MADVPVQGFRKYWRKNSASLKSEFHAITNKYPEVDSVVQEIYKFFNDIEILTGCTPVNVGEISEWTTTVNSAEENRANFCKVPAGNLLFSALFGMYTVTLNELMPS